ncbi:MAG: hypothetical protein LQ338_007911, partial [Usnochroma carphineum]
MGLGSDSELGHGRDGLSAVKDFSYGEVSRMIQGSVNGSSNVNGPRKKFFCQFSSKARILSASSITESPPRAMLPKPIIYINSWPGVGKNTIAKALAANLGPETLVIPKHLHIDLTEAVLPRSCVEYPIACRRHRQATFQTLEESDESLDYTYIFTDFQTSSPEGGTVAEEYRSVAIDRGCAFIPVILVCDAEENARRMMSEDKVEKVAHGKGMLLDTKALEEMRGRGEIYEFGCPEEVVVDVSRLTADEAAKLMAEHVKKIIADSVDDGSSVSDKHSFQTTVLPCDDGLSHTSEAVDNLLSSPASTALVAAPPPFSSLYFPPAESPNHIKPSVAEPDSCPPPPFTPVETTSSIASNIKAETKAALPSDTKGESSSNSADDKEPPPPYTEGSSPLGSFTYIMAAAGGPASIITQVPQGGPSPPGGNAFSDVGPDENINLDLRGTKFTLSRDELLTLPEFVLLSLFPNGLLPDGHMNSFHEGDTYPVDYDPASLQYMLDFFRTVAQTIPSSSPSPVTDTPSTETNMPGSARDMLQDRAGIIVLREDLDFYAIPHKADIDHSEMIEVKRAAGRALLRQDGIFSGLRKSEEAGTTEQHLIEMLTAGGFDNDDRWGHRASEPKKAVICSLALARLRTDIKGNDLANSNAVGMAQKLLLFWRKPARRCWWEGVELDDVEGVEGKLKVWIRRVWTLEM